MGWEGVIKRHDGSNITRYKIGVFKVLKQSGRGYAGLKVKHKRWMRVLRGFKGMQVGTECDTKELFFDQEKTRAGAYDSEKKYKIVKES